MPEYKASILIEATAAEVWSVLLDTATYPEWNPDCSRIEGRLMDGQVLRIHSRSNPSGATVKVVELHPCHKMVWAAEALLGLFTGVRTVILTAKERRLTKVVVKETFSGLLLALGVTRIERMREPFTQFCQCLKQRVESAG